MICRGESATMRVDKRIENIRVEDNVQAEYSLEDSISDSANSAREVFARTTIGRVEGLRPHGRPSTVKRSGEWRASTSSLGGRLQVRDESQQTDIASEEQ